MEIQIDKQQAVSLFLTESALARALGVSRQAVNQWPDGPIPAKHALAIRYVLRPECFERPKGGK